METEKNNKYRWVILSLLFLATTINYFDRIVLSTLYPEIKDVLSIGAVQYTYINTAFQIMYTVGFIGAGTVIDRMGTKRGYGLCIFAWSIVASLASLSRSAFSLSFWRGLLGLSESGNFPAAMKAVSEWFPAKERAFATSLYNSGPSIATIIGPPIIVALYYTVGWRWTFVVMASLGFVLVAFWPFIYKQPKTAPANNQKLQKENNDSIRWRELLKHKETYGIMFGKFCTDPVWWFYMFWMPDYLKTQRGFDLKEIAIAIPLIYIIAIIFGNIAGWAAGYLIGKGWKVKKARKTVMFVCAMCLPISAFAVKAGNPWVAILLVSLACSAHNGWSANIFTLVTDCFPARAVGSATGLAGFAGGVGGILIAGLAPGYIIEYLGYIPIFILMGILHPIAYLAIRLLIKDTDVAKVHQG